jgi:lipase maturation factor 1
LVMELGIVWMFLLPRRWRIACFFIVTPWEIGVILTANYTFLNYLVLALGVLLLDDQFLRGLIPVKRMSREPAPSEPPQLAAEPFWSKFARAQTIAGLAVSAFMLSWIFYATLAEMLATYRLPKLPVVALEPFRIANRYGLFAVMTRGRYEIEFQGSDDGENWKPYGFRYKPQDLKEAPRIYAPYQPRFDWNLWFASLGSWREYMIVPNTVVRLLSNDKAVLQLFADNPFPQAPPREIRTVLWQYWFTSPEEKRISGQWWKRQLIGRYGPTLEKTPDGNIRVIEWADVPPRE